MFPSLRRRLAVWLLLCLPLAAQPIPTPTTLSSPTATGTPSPPEATPLSLPDIASQLEEAKTLLAEMEVRLHGSATESQLLLDFDPQISEMQRQAATTLKALAKNPSLPELHDLETDWQGRDADLKGIYDRLTALDAQRAAEQSGLDEQSKTWAVTAAAQSASAPTALQQSIAELRDSILALQKKESDARGRIFLSLAEVARAQMRVRNLLATVRQARESKVQRIFVRDGVPFWRLDPRRQLDGNIVGDLVVSLESDKDEMLAFAATHSERFLIHLFCFLVLVAALRWARATVAPWAQDEPGLDRAVTVFSTPIASALLLTAFMTPWIYSRAPVMVSVALAALSLVPAAIVLRRLLAPELYPLLNAMIASFCIDQLRALSVSQFFLSRLLFGAETLGAVLFLAWLRRQRLFSGHVRLRAACLMLGGILLFALLANLFGYRGLSYWLGDGTIHSAYLAVFLFASVEVVGGLTLLTLRLPPMNLLASVRENRRHFRRSILWLVRLLAIVAWLALTLDSMALLTPISDWLSSVLRANLALGALRISLGGLLAAALVIWLTSRISRWSRYVLELDVYPRFQMERGVDYTLSTIIHYLILLLGVLFGLAAVGVDTTKFTIVAGALSVGIGFGLQNIVNNFVSGLILLFERPIKVGDMIQVNEQVGLLKQVGLRASVLRTTEGAEVIVPNGQLLSTQVTNWTLSDPLRRLHLDIGVAYGNKPRAVMDLLLAAAVRCADVLPDPKPNVLFVGLGDSSLDFRVQVWTKRSQTYPQMQSDLLLRLYDALEAANIEVPYPHRTISVDNWPSKPEQET